MPATGRQDEIVNTARRWPKKLRARLHSGVWHLSGADAGVYGQFASCANWLADELGFPLVGANPVEALLYRLMKRGYDVHRAAHDTIHRVRSMKTTSKGLIVVISPLRDALVKFLDQCGTTPLKDGSTGPKERLKSGQRAAAEKNLQRQARVHIMTALQHQGVPLQKWPACLKMALPAEFCQQSTPPPFQPPDFDRLSETAEVWKKKADAAWQVHRDQYLESQRFFTVVGVDEEVLIKRDRGIGEKKRNAPPRVRFEWTALHISGIGWKDISARDFEGQYYKADQIRKAVTAVLTAAGCTKQG